jgi:hypothetical protein
VGGGEIPPYFAQHALAATDTEVAVVVMQYDDPIGTHHLQLERLAPDLSFLGRSTLDDLRPSGAPAENIFGTALAPLASGGWIVAACGQPEAFFLAVDATGQTRSRVVLSSSLRGDGCYTGVPVLAASPNGGPLILWQDDAGAMMSVIAADGRSATPPRRVLDGFPLKGDNGTAAWIGNEFVVALPVETDPTNGLRALRLLRVAPDGTYRIDGDFLTGQFGSVASIASGPDARDVRILYWGIPRGGDINTDYSLFWWRLDGTEEVGPVMLAEPGDFYGFSPAVAVGDDTFVLAGLNLGDGFGVLRVASDGSVVSPYRDLFRNPPSYGGGAAIARRGPGIVVSFIGPTRMHFARLTP